MIKAERHKIIMREINLHNKVFSTDLAALLSISDDTVRRDLNELIASKQVLKIHGGAVSKSFVTPFITDSNVYALAAKQNIAQKTIKLLKNDMVILTEGGTTIIEFAKSIPRNLKATFFTISPQVAITLADHENLEVITIGGRLNKNANLHTGSSVINELSGLKADLCLLGANAFSVEDGLSDMDWEIVQVKKAIVRSSKKVAVLSISEKLNTSQRIQICDIGNINYLITELPANSHFLSAYSNTSLKII
jgi:DeoR/GlpR family transcriptional regulator of sugar metabolism